MSDKISAELFVDIARPQDVRISKDGKQVVYVVQGMTRKDSGSTKTSIWLATVGEKNSARQLTDGEYNDSSPAFSPDGYSIAFISDRTEVGKDNDLFLMHLKDTTNVTKLTSSSEQGTVDAFQWTPDGYSIIFNAQPKEDPNLDVKVYGENIRYHKLWRVDVDDIYDVWLIRSEDADINMFDISPDGSQVVYTTREEPGWTSQVWGQDIKILDRPTETSKLVHRVPAGSEGVTYLAWSEKGPMIGAVCDLKDMHRSKALYLVQPEGLKRLAYGETNDLMNLKTCWGKSVAYVHEGMKDSLRSLDDSILFDTKQSVSSFDVAWNGQDARIALVKDSTGRPAEVYSLVGGELCQLSQHGQYIAEMKLGKCVLIEEKEDGLPYDGIWCVPASLQSDFDNRKPLPTVVLCKGGPYGRHNDMFDASNVGGISPYLLSQEYLMLQPNYRGCSSHGDAYAYSVFGNAQISYEDVIWHVKKGIKDGRIDPDRVAITGWSQGGYLTYLAVTRPLVFRFKAGAACAGVSDLYTETVTSDIPVIEAMLMGFRPWDKEAKTHDFSKGSPLQQAHQTETPLLILHGEQDDRVTIQNAQMFSLALKEHGKSFEMAIYPREGHGAKVRWERAHMIDLLERMGRYFKKHLGEKA